jgi:RHS repeat-associated protein
MGLPKMAHGALTPGSPLASQYPFLFTGRVPVVGSIYYYRARFYDSLSGRFISEDPMGQLAGPNGYAYSKDSPSQGQDPTGLLTQPWGPGMGGLFGPADCSLPYCFAYHGNWGGPHYSGGEFVVLDRMSNGSRSKLKGPTDLEDRCYMAHDYCYVTMRMENSCPYGTAKKSGKQISAESFCDSQLRQCILNLPDDDFYNSWSAYGSYWFFLLQPGLKWSGIVR